MIDLHCHLFGCLDAEAVLARAARAGHAAFDWYAEEYELAYGSYPPLAGILGRHRGGDATAAADFRRLYEFHGQGFDRFQAHANLLAAILDFPRAADGPLSQALADELRWAVGLACAGHRAQGITRVEYRLMLPARYSLAFARRWLERLLAELAREEGPGFAPRLVLGLPRSAPLRLWPAVAEALAGEHGRLLVGIDAAGPEEGHGPPCELLARLAAWRRERPDLALAACVHIGETWADVSQLSALRRIGEAVEAGAQRLGHALALGLAPERALGRPCRERADERRRSLAWLAHRAWAEAEPGEDARLAALAPEALVERPCDAAEAALVRRVQDLLLADCARRGVVIESCPTSNRRIAALAEGEHPLPRFLAAGVAVVIGADDPGLLGCSLADELAWAERVTGRSRAAFLAVAEAATGERLAGRPFPGPPRPE